MIVPNRTGSSTAYRYGFNGKEKDDELKGEGNHYDYGMRISDPRIGKFFSVDPLTKKFAMLTPYQFASNRPIDGIDLDGMEYLRFDKVKELGNKLINFYHENGGLGFDIVEYKGNKYYNVGAHLKGANNTQITQWVYTPIASVIPSGKYVGYGDVEPHDCMTASKAQIAKQDLVIGGYDKAVQMFKSGNQGNKINKGLGLDLIQKSLEEGNSVIVGVDYNSNKTSNPGTDNTTDHFVTVVGRGNDKNGEFFTFYENATSDPNTGTDVSTNKLYLQTNGTLKGDSSWGNQTFTVTQVRPTEKKKVTPTP